MSTPFSYAAARNGAANRPGKPSPSSSSRNDPRGRPTTGRIAKMLIGQCHGYIRLRDAREVFFHRADVRDGTAFNDLRIGDAVTFELLEDVVSGARALRVRRRKAGERFAESEA